MTEKTPTVTDKSITMQDVALRANVSQMTVSRALFDPEKVSEETRAKILRIVDELGYVPNRLARNFGSNRSNVIGIIGPDIKNSIFAATVQSAEEVLRRAGYELMIAHSGLSLESEEALIASFISHRVCGMILHNTSHTDRARQLIRQAQIPVVETGDLAANPIEMTVSYSNFDAAREMTRFLASRGYNVIGFVSLSTAENSRSRERQRGYCAALEELSLPYEPQLVMEVEAGYEGGRKAISHLIESFPRIDAVFMGGDVLAVGASLECQRRGWPIPGRIAIATFDDIDILAHLLPPLTSLRLPREKIGRRSAELLLDRLSGQDVALISENLGFEIIERSST
jgi:LacI family gluconate utilization system Gnt-I transcriptional repressor